MKKLHNFISRNIIFSLMGIGIFLAPIFATIQVQENRNFLYVFSQTMQFAIIGFYIGIAVKAFSFVTRRVMLFSTNYNIQRKKIRTPPLDLLTDASQLGVTETSDGELEINARRAEQAFLHAGIRGEIYNVYRGPIYSVYEFTKFDKKEIKPSKLCKALSKYLNEPEIHVIAEPNNNIIKVELPNTFPVPLPLKTIIATEAPEREKQNNTLAFGHTTQGTPVYINMKESSSMLLFAHTLNETYQALHVLILSTVYKYSPKDCRIIIIDSAPGPMNEYNCLPHLIIPVVDDAENASHAIHELDQLIQEETMSSLGTNSSSPAKHPLESVPLQATKHQITECIATKLLNTKNKRNQIRNQNNTKTEFFTLLLVPRSDDLIQALGQGFAAKLKNIAKLGHRQGIHLVMFSKPTDSTNLKNAFAYLCSFKTNSKKDSKLVLGTAGAERLRGHGDMLLVEGSSSPIRVQLGAISNNDILKTVNYYRYRGIKSPC